ncbi:MAG: HD domain-containing protein [Chitinophagales bacterium]
MKRIELILKDPSFIDYINRNTLSDQEHRYCKHDLAHMIDVARITYILILEQQSIGNYITTGSLSGKMAARETIYAAGLLHDIGKWKEYMTGEDHAAFGARLAREMLPRLFFNDNEIDVISQAIFEHRNISKDMSFLGEKLHRADNLSRVCSQCTESTNCLKYQNKEIGTHLLVY